MHLSWLIALYSSKDALHVLGWWFEKYSFKLLLLLWSTGNYRLSNSYSCFLLYLCLRSRYSQGQRWVLRMFDWYLLDIIWLQCWWHEILYQLFGFIFYYRLASGKYCAGKYCCRMHMRKWGFRHMFTTYRCLHLLF